MFPLSTRFILLVSSLAAAYFAFWFGSYIGELTGWAWSVGNQKDAVPLGLFAFGLGVVVSIAFIAGMICSLVGAATALTIARSTKNTEEDVQDMYVAAAFACLLLCFTYGTIATPGAVPWYMDKWNLLLVFAITPSVFALKQVLFDRLFSERATPTPADVIPFNRKSS